MKYINGVQKPLASDTINTPAGNIAAADVQTAVNELDTEKLALAGGTMTGDLTFSGAQKIIGGTGTTSDLTLQTTSGVGAAGADMHFLVGNNGATEAATILNNGNVGIGTASPRGKLDIWGQDTANPPTPLANAVSQGTIILGDVSGSVGSALGVMQNGASYDTYIQARNLGAASLAFNLILQPLGGNVGIGTTTPAGRLHVTGNADDEQLIVDFNATQSSVTQPVLFRNSAGSNLIAFTSLGGAVFNEQGNDADFRIEGDTDANLFFVDASADRVGIGTVTPRALLDISTGYLVGTGLQLPHVVNKTASANVRNSHDAEATTQSTGYVKLKTITLTNGLVGQQRFLFDLKTSNVANIANARLYRNGVALGTEQSDVTGGYVTKSEDITQTWSPGDTAELWAKIDNALQTAYVQNFRIAYDDSPTVAVASANS